MLLLTVVEALTIELRVAHVGSTVNLSCDTSDGEHVSWQFLSTVSLSWRRVVYYPSRISDRLRTRYAVSYNNLSINDVQHCDAGDYQCVFISGDKFVEHFIHLIVIGKFTLAKVNNTATAINICHVKYNFT